MSTAMDSLLDRFRRMVEHDGGELTVLAVTPGDVRLRYRAAAADPGCVDGVCVMPHRELEQLIGETVARQWPGVRVHVEPDRTAAGQDGQATTEAGQAEEAAHQPSQQ
jgi:Fe-S cluster biogenesis protein NfuA